MKETEQWWIHTSSENNISGFRGGNERMKLSFDETAAAADADADAAIKTLNPTVHHNRLQSDQLN